MATKEKITPDVSAPAKPSALSGRALLVKMTVHAWPSIITDDEVGGRAAKDFSAATDAGYYRKRLISKADSKEWRSIINKLRENYLWYTLPWDDRGFRVISGAVYLEWLQKHNALVGDFNAELDRFYANYDAICRSNDVRLGGMKKLAEFPPLADVKKKFGIERFIRPIDSGDDFRVDVGNDELARMKKELSDEAEARLAQGMKSAYERLAQVVGHMAARLKAYQVVTDDQGKEHVENSFKDSLVENITELLGVIPALNIAEDPALDQFAADIRRQLTSWSPQVLRDDKDVREEVAQAAADILKKMEAFI